VVLIQNDATIPIDVSLGAMPFEERVPLEPHDAAVPLEGEHVGRRFMRGVQGRVTRTRR
jgi:hypothetical protein